MRQTYTAPTRKTKGNPEFKEAIVEKIPSEWGLGDTVDEFRDKGYEIVEDGPRRVRMQIPYSKFLEQENKAKQEAERRLMAPDNLGKGFRQSVRTTEVSEKQMAESLPDNIDLDE